MLIASSVVLTEVDTPSAVFISPWTIHGWRPFSVSIQPAVFIRNGARTAQVATTRNTRDCVSLRRYSSQAPHSASSVIRLPR